MYFEGTEKELVEADAPAAADAPKPTVKHDGGDKLAEIKYEMNRAAIKLAYENYLAQTPDEKTAEDALFKEIIKFAKMKLEGDLWDLPESVKTPDDYAQELVIYVSQHLQDVKGGPDSFYPWLNRICYTTGAGALNEIVEEQEDRVSLFVEADDESGDMVDNPLIYREEFPEHGARKLPAFIQGIDLLICRYILEGYEYAEIGQLLVLTEGAIKMRVKAMKTKIEEMKTANKGKLPPDEDEIVKPIPLTPQSCIRAFEVIVSRFQEFSGNGVTLQKTRKTIHPNVIVPTAIDFLADVEAATRRSLTARELGYWSRYYKPKEVLVSSKSSFGPPERDWVPDVFVLTPEQIKLEQLGFDSGVQTHLDRQPEAERDAIAALDQSTREKLGGRLLAVGLFPLNVYLAPVDCSEKRVMRKAQLKQEMIEDGTWPPQATSETLYDLYASADEAAQDAEYEAEEDAKAEDDEDAA